MLITDTLLLAKLQKNHITEGVSSKKSCYVFRYNSSRSKLFLVISAFTFPV